MLIGCRIAAPGLFRTDVMHILLTAIGALFCASLVWFHFESVREHEPVAARRSLWLAILLPLPYLACAWLPLPGVQIVGWILACGTLLGIAVLLVPTGRPRGFKDEDPQRRVDERTIMFSRAALEPGSERFDEYYRTFPHHRENDDRFRSLPGLLGSDSGCAEPLLFAAAAASFGTIDHLAGLVDGEPAAAALDVDASVATRFFKGWARKLGAVDCGVAELKPTHFYSVKGRGERWGQPVESRHRFALAFTVEMDARSLGQAPHAPTVMESAQQYLASGAIAVQMAECIRRLGWSAQAHIDANYQVICPLVARDAGLGEIGRMGLLMTPKLGPRVRIAVVTTDLPLEVDGRRSDPTVLHFCQICRKCAEVCPPGALPKGDRELFDGARRWKIDDEACFAYWCSTGTDCGRCMRVCPYSHPDTFLHGMIRLGLSNSFLFRHFALRLDDLMYGRRPGRLPRAAWLPRRQGGSKNPPRAD